MRQLRYELGKENVMFVHVAPIVTVTTSGEMKTKAIQHSIIKLRELGIQADVLVCRTPHPLED
jgi:CTP synthase